MTEINIESKIKDLEHAVKYLREGASNNLRERAILADKIKKLEKDIISIDDYLFVKAVKSNLNHWEVIEWLKNHKVEDLTK